MVFLLSLQDETDIVTPMFTACSSEQCL